MNFRKMIINIWLFLNFLLIVSIIISHNYYEKFGFLLKTIIIIFAVIVALINSVFWLYLILFAGRPNNLLDLIGFNKIKKFGKLHNNTMFYCEQIDKFNYKVIIENGPYKSFLNLNLKGWVFKKTYIRDFILANYHIDYYNEKKYEFRKLMKKKYFKFDNINIVFILLNGKSKRIPLIIHGKEKRSFFLSLKFFFPKCCFPRYDVPFKESALYRFKYHYVSLLDIYI